VGDFASYCWRLATTFMLAMRNNNSFLIVCFFLLSACHEKEKYQYAIHDFRKLLQPALTEIVTKGILEYSEQLESIHQEIKDKELTDLFNSEIPILRAAAFREILSRPSFNHFEIMMNHLDDTAIFQREGHELGFYNMTVSDYVITKSTWANEEQKSLTVDKVLLNHNYLQSAYKILLNLQPQERYYSIVKQMTKSNKYFMDLEYAFLYLAKFKKAEDVSLIKTFLLENKWRLGSISFQLLREYPKAEYIEILEQYFVRRKYKTFMYSHFKNVANEFVETLASYKNEKSAMILMEMLNKSKCSSYDVEASQLKTAVENAIWENPCQAYNSLRKKVAHNIEEQKKGIIEIDLTYKYLDTAKRIIRWR
jgi:hypothetical protein